MNRYKKLRIEHINKLRGILDLPLKDNHFLQSKNKGIIYLIPSPETPIFLAGIEGRSMSKSTISTFELFAMFPDQETARVYLEGRLWPDGPRCPVCGLDERGNGGRTKLLKMDAVDGVAGKRLTYKALTA